MTKLLEQALMKARALPPTVQDEIARLVLSYTGDDQPLVMLSPEEEAALDESDAAADRGEFATDDQIRAIWAKYGL